jgi:hypothetical protein
VKEFNNVPEECDVIGDSLEKMFIYLIVEEKRSKVVTKGAGPFRNKIPHKVYAGFPTRIKAPQ